MMLSFHIPETLDPWLRVGTCSWKYDSWKGLIYDPDKSYRADDYLPDYSKKLKSVEVDQWFWSLFPRSVRLPDPDTVRFYAASVPDDFVFSVKAPNGLTLTHYYSQKTGKAGDRAGQPNPEFLSLELLSRFLEILSPWGPKLGPIIFQFEYLNKQKMPSPAAFLDRFGAFIDRAPRGFAYALETRNPNFVSPQFFAFLKEHDLGFVGLEGYYMPPLAEVFDKFKPEMAPFIVLRLHGGNRQEIESAVNEKWDRVVAPKPAAIETAARIVQANARRKVLTYLNVNNHFEGSAPLSIERFLHALEKSEA